MNAKLTNRVEFDHDQPQFQKILREIGRQAVMVAKFKPGSVTTDLVQSIDFAETFLDRGGIPAPEPAAPASKKVARNRTQAEAHYHAGGSSTGDHGSP